MADHDRKVKLQEVTDPREIAEAADQRAHFDRNSAWLESNVDSIYSQHRGKCICIAGCELFVDDDVEEAVRQARKAHPADKGWFTRYIPVERVTRVYAS